MAKKMPWIWPEGSENEQVAVAACGCKLHRDFRDSGDPAFEMCKLHREAPTMRRMLQSVVCSDPGTPKDADASVCVCLTGGFFRKIRRLVEKL
jgi:hypothetical protein